MGIVDKGLEVAAKVTDKASDQNPVAKFAKETVLRDRTMKDAFVAKFQFLKEDLLGPKRSKFEASSKTRIDDFLRRMIVENPEEIVHSYAEHLVGFGADTPREDFQKFATELGMMKLNVVRILGVIKKDPKFESYIQQMDQFSRYLDLMIATANGFAAMTDEDRKKLLSGDKDGLTSGHKAVLDNKVRVELLKNKVFTKAQVKEDRMKAVDREVIEALDEIYARELAKEKALRNKIGKDKEDNVDDEPKEGKLLKFPKRKSTQNKQSKGGQARSKKESFIEEMSEAA